MTTTISSPPIVPISDLPQQNVPLKLRCQACKTVGSYKVGRLLVDPNYLRNVDLTSPQSLFPSLAKLDWAKWVSFAGYFTCDECGSGGPWDISPQAKREIALLMVKHIINPEDSGIFVGKAVLFDGTTFRTGYASVAHLRKLIDADPKNAFLWNRLGNTFVGADEPVLAIPAFTQAFELNPLDLESLHSLGEIHFNRGDYDAAAPCFHRLLADCKKGVWYRKEIKEDVLLSVIDMLLEISASTKQRIPFMPKQPRPADGGEGEKVHRLELHTFDLSKESERRRLLHLFLDEPAPPLQAIHQEWQQKPLAPAFVANRSEPRRSGADRAGRNDPCPCGSGKKYKKCCYR